MKKLLLIIGLVFIPVINVTAQIPLDTLIGHLNRGLSEKDLIDMLGNNLSKLQKEDESLKIGNYEITSSKGEIYLSLGDKSFSASLYICSVYDEVNMLMIEPVEEEKYRDRTLCSYMNDKIHSRYSALYDNGIYKLNNCNISVLYSEFDNNCIIGVFLQDISDFIDWILQQSVSDSYNKKIQNEFFGIPFGTYYTEVKRMMSTKNYYDISDRNGLTYCDIEFAGIEWDFCEFKFNADNEFSGIQFQQYSNSETVIIDRYNALKNRLIGKYSEKEGFLNSEIDNWESDKKIEISIFSLSSLTSYCGLSAHYGESRGKEFYYYLNLTYKDVGRMDSEDDEL